MAQAHNPNLIYESPDGGKTIYRRTLGNPTRELHYEDPTVAATKLLQQENQLWHNIRVAAMNHTQLADMLEQVKVYYHLINEDSHHNQV